MGSGRIEVLPEEQLSTWAILELFGHKRLAGFVTQQSIGAAALIRIDVPDVQLDDDTRSYAFTKYVGPGAIYCLTPCSEEVARAAAQRFVRWDPPIPVEFQPRLAAGAPADAELVDEGEELEEGDLGEGTDEEIEQLEQELGHSR